LVERDDLALNLFKCLVGFTHFVILDAEPSGEVRTTGTGDWALGAVFLSQAQYLPRPGVPFWGFHSYTSQPSISTFCGTCWVVSVTKTAQVEKWKPRWYSAFVDDMPRYPKTRIQYRMALMPVRELQGLTLVQCSA